MRALSGGAMGGVDYATNQDPTHALGAAAAGAVLNKTLTFPDEPPAEGRDRLRRTQVRMNPMILLALYAPQTYDLLTAAAQLRHELLGPPSWGSQDPTGSFRSCNSSLSRRSHHVIARRRAIQVLANDRMLGRVVGVS
jgi:hypothetical protein